MMLTIWNVRHWSDHQDSLFPFPDVKQEYEMMTMLNRESNKLYLKHKKKAWKKTPKICVMGPGFDR